jgi:pimeloyl-ACP methyl ester carboxylesterase
MADYRACRFRAQDDLEIHYRDYPGPRSKPGRPLLCLGGMTRNASDFHELACRQASRRRVVCPDYRGRGRSGRAAEASAYAPETCLGDLSHLLAITGLHGVVALGTSYGGLMACGLAVANPMALSGIILNDVAADIDPGFLERLLPYVEAEPPQPDIETGLARLKDCFADIHFRDEETWRRFAEGTYRQGDDGRFHPDWDPALATLLRQAVEEPRDLTALFRAIRGLPVLALRGERSTAVTEAAFAELRRHLPQASFVTVPGLGHAPSLDEPEAIAAIDDFLETLDA